MSIKTKRIIAFSVLIVLLAAIISAILIIKFADNGNGKTDEGFEVWKELPFSHSENKESKSYASFKEAFAEILQPFISALKAESEDTGKNASLKSAYVTTDGTPTAVVTYTDRNEKLHFMILKYIDGKVCKLFDEAPFDAVSDQNEILIYSDCNVIIIRSGIESELGKQTIYDLREGSYIAVKYNEYEFGHAADMSATFAEYNADAKAFVSYSEKAVTGDVIAYLDTALGVKLEETAAVTE